jgi:hypothetical protein
MAMLSLVSCVSMKRRTPSQARDLYTSPWFLKARAYVEATKSPWLILSAEYGLLRPDQIVAPYERTLNTMGIEDRRAWARRVLDALVPQLSGVERVIVLAGKRYREFLLPTLRRNCPAVEVPMEGLTIGRQLRWLSERRA